MRNDDADNGSDMIDLTAYGFANAAAALAFFSQVGANVRFINGLDILVVENEVLANIASLCDLGLIRLEA